MSLVIIGSGVYAISLANKYKKKHVSQKITLIALHDETVYLPAAPRSIVDGDASRNVRSIPKMLNEGIDLITGTVTEICESSVTYTSGGISSTLEFGVLVVATGAHHSMPNVNTGNFVSACSESKQQLAEAKKIVILGGGEFGVELAGEIRDAYPEKNITIVHSQKQILSGKYKDNVRAKVAGGLAEQKIDVLLGSTGTVSGKTVVVRSENDEVTLEADYVANCVGAVGGNFPPVCESLKEIVDSKNYAIVDLDFATKARNIFAVGDVARIGSFVYKDAYLDVVASNILLAMQGSWKTGFKQSIVETTFPTAALSLGAKKGFGQAKVPIFGTVTLPGMIVVSFKCGDLMVSKIPEMYSV